MLFKDLPIKRKLVTAILITSGTVLFLTCSAYCIYEFITFRQTTIRQLTTLGAIIASNSTAALAFESPDEAYEILSALKAERNIVAACLYDKKGNIFSWYPAEADPKIFPQKLPSNLEYHFSNNHLEGFQSVAQTNRTLGTLYIKSDLKEMYDRFKLYGIVALLVILCSSLVAFLLSRVLQTSISKPILELASVAKRVSENNDYSVRANKLGEDEIGSLTEAFNQMLTQIQEQNLVLSKFNQELELKVADRTTELKAANKELEAFSYSVSHDLRAPLRAIHGYMNIFMEDYGDKFDNEAKRITNNILINSKKMGQLIDDLLAFSQLGRKKLLKTPVAMKNIVANIWNDLSRMENNRTIEFNLQELPNVYADEAILKHVWSNLISNALKYSGHNEKTIITIGFEETEESITYFVKDNGVGFDMSYYEKLFGVFQRLHSQDQFDGTGVGLAIAQRIIHKHEGKIWAESAPEAGATFYFSLPKQPS
jgi:signal transduction histidine kinase